MPALPEGHPGGRRVGPAPAPPPAPHPRLRAPSAGWFPRRRSRARCATRRARPRGSTAIFDERDVLLMPTTARPPVAAAAVGGQERAADPVRDVDDLPLHRPVERHRPAACWRSPRAPRRRPAAGRAAGRAARTTRPRCSRWPPRSRPSVGGRIGVPHGGIACSRARDPNPRHPQRRAAAARAARARQGWASTPAGRPSTAASTSGTRARYVVFSLLKRFLEHEGFEATLVVNVTDVNDKIYDAAREAGVPSAELARGDDRRLRGGHRPPRHSAGPTPSRRPARRSSRSSTLIADLVESGHAYAAGGDVYFRVASFGGLRQALQPPARGDAAGRGRRRRGRSRRRRRTSRSGRRTRRARTRAGTRPGGGAPGLAHRVLRDGRADPRRRLRDPRRRLGPRLPPPRERDRPDRGRARRSRWPGSGCTTAWSRWAPRRWPSRWATSGCCTGRSTSSGREAWSCTS